jgi:hypothetical protein
MHPHLKLTLLAAFLARAAAAAGLAAAPQQAQQTTLLLVNHSREEGTVEDLDCDRGMSGDKCC